MAIAISALMIGTTIVDAVEANKKEKERKAQEAAEKEAEIFANKMAEKLKTAYYKIESEKERDYHSYL
jgi:hypothetical protein